MHRCDDCVFLLCIRGGAKAYLGLAPLGPAPWPKAAPCPPLACGFPSPWFGLVLGLGLGLGFWIGIRNRVRVGKMAQCTISHSARICVLPRWWVGGLDVCVTGGVSRLHHAGYLLLPHECVGASEEPECVVKPCVRGRVKPRDD